MSKYVKDVFVATPDRKIENLINSNGGNCIRTEKDILMELVGLLKHVKISNVQISFYYKVMNPLFCHLKLIC